jgi:hypothetical protein
VHNRHASRAATGQKRSQWSTKDDHEMRLNARLALVPDFESRIRTPALPWLSSTQFFGPHRLDLIQCIAVLAA